MSPNAPRLWRSATILRAERRTNPRQSLELLGAGPVDINLLVGAERGGQPPDGVAMCPGVAVPG